MVLLAHSSDRSGRSDRLPFHFLDLSGQTYPWFVLCARSLTMFAVWDRSLCVARLLARMFALRDTTLAQHLITVKARIYLNDLGGDLSVVWIVAFFRRRNVQSIGTNCDKLLVLFIFTRSYLPGTKTTVSQPVNDLHTRQINSHSRSRACGPDRSLMGTICTTWVMLAG